MYEGREGLHKAVFASEYMRLNLPGCKTRPRQSLSMHQFFSLTPPLANPVYLYAPKAPKALSSPSDKEGTSWCRPTACQPNNHEAREALTLCGPRTSRMIRLLPPISHPLPLCCPPLLSWRLSPLLSWRR